MTRAFNFSAGPAMLPVEVLQRAQSELVDWNGSGMSVMEMSHRGPEFMGIAQQAEANLRTLLAIPANYKVLFMQGGASAQFALIPLNLRAAGQSADYIVTGSWSVKAVKEAELSGATKVIATTKADKFTRVPDAGELKFSADAAYVHYTPNETIEGVEFPYVPDTGDIPLIGDFSSTILSRPLDIARFGMVYAGAQKNIGPAGLTLVIIRDDLLARCPDNIPSVFSYKTMAAADSMYNTPPTYAWYLSGLVFEWLLQQGGLTAMAETNQRKAGKLYDYIDNSGFYQNPVQPDCRSWMNVPFTLPTAELDKPFLEQAKTRQLLTLKGHRSVGGMRASIYNAMPEAGIDALVGFMQEFAKQNS